MKNAAALFGGELLKYLGISQSVSAVMPTEMVRLEVRHMYEDFNFQTADGGWLHFEFESDALSLADLKRFREYEATTSRTHEAAVTICVLCSAGQSSIKSSFHEGINTYRVKLIRLKRKNADLVFRRLKEKQKKGEHLTQEDLFPLLLSPLMSGSLPPDRPLSGRLPALKNRREGYRPRESGTDAGTAVCVCGKIFKQG